MRVGLWVGMRVGMWVGLRGRMRVGLRVLYTFTHSKMARRLGLPGSTAARPGANHLAGVAVVEFVVAAVDFLIAVVHKRYYNYVVG